MLDKRLKMCADMISDKGIVCDVGTDHALLAAELIMSGRCARVIASDIKEGPLESARKTVEKYGISDKVELVLSDGLENVNLDGVSDIVIAGMGGETISDIIGKSGIYDENIRFILQPMSKSEILRKWLYDNGFCISAEKSVEDGDKIYSIISAHKCTEQKKRLTEYEAIVGFFDEDDEIGRKYRKKESERLAKVSDSLEKAGKVNESVHYSALSTRVFNAERNVSVKISEIYDYLNEKFPFALQEKWDNSGLLVNHNSEYCSKLLLTLDITNSVISEAYEKKANLIISHHPVIFDPLKKIDSYNPVYNLVNRGINAICMHTNLDIAEGGTNTVIVKKLSEKLEISENIQPFEEIGNGVGLGYIVELNETIDSSQFALILKEIFGCKCLKMNDNGKKYISKIAVCSGSGGSLLGLAMVKDCDAMITGDVKHDVWIDANNHCFTLFDCGHFHTENHVLWELRRVLEEKFPLLDVEIAESSVDPCVYF